MAKHHLAQLDVGRLRYPLGSGEADEFIAALDPVNALVDAAPGFVWRLTDVGGKDSAAIDPAEDLITNLTVWESREAMWEFTYRAEHREFRQRRREWFRPQADASTVLWWIQAGHIPTPLEGRDRLYRLRESRPTPAAFTFGQHLEPVETQLATL
jgi:heme-degrading monooxygenase HmoA